jgi:predicted Zn-dependent protease
VEFLRTHPLGTERIEAMEELACEHRRPQRVDTIPLPSFIPQEKRKMP